jgi:hypothetical protein
MIPDRDAGDAPIGIPKSQRNHRLKRNFELLAARFALLG